MTLARAGIVRWPCASGQSRRLTENVPAQTGCKQEHVGRPAAVSTLGHATAAAREDARSLHAGAGCYGALIASTGIGALAGNKWRRRG
jgi:hypothetical protein